jgi:hypothetical protein
MKKLYLVSFSLIAMLFGVIFTAMSCVSTNTDNYVAPKFSEEYRSAIKGELVEIDD